MIILDTNVMIEIFDKKSKKGEVILEKLEGYNVSTTSLNLHEIAYGFNKIGKKLPDEIKFLRVFEFTPQDALLSAEIESKLEKAGNIVGRFDTMIASVCINRSAQLATFNKRHFEKIRGFGLKLFEF